MKTLSRRQFLQRLSLAGAMTTVPATVFAQTRPKLTIPPLIDVGRGRPIRLDFRPAQAQFNQGKLVEVWGANGQYLGPTVRVRSNDFVKLTYLNNLPQPLSINIQGLLAPTEMIGSQLRSLNAGASWSPIISVHQPACTAWYHADSMLNSAYQVYRGVVGMWLVEDDESRKAQLPNKYGVNDIPLILQDQLITKQGEQAIDSQQLQFFGSRLFVNGQESPYLSVARSWVRLRIVNASLSRPYSLRLDNGKPLQLIATGVGMLAEPVEMDSIQLAPSERVEVLVDMNEGGNVSLISGEPRDLLFKVKQLFSDNNELQDNVILELRPEGLVSAFNNTPQLVPFNVDDFALSIAQERRLVIRPLDRVINKQRFDPKRIDFTIKQGTVERWYIHSDEAIGFTLQGAKFIVETRGGQQVPHKQLAWRDTVWIEKNQEITLLIKFEQNATTDLPFSFGVSDLMLRDRGCMGQFTVS